MSNLNAFRKQALQHRIVGQNIGERREIEHKKAQQLNNIPAAGQKQVDAFSSRNPQAAESFRDKGDRFLGKVARYIHRQTTDHAGYRHERVQRIHDGYTPPTSITDDQRLAFLETVIRTSGTQTAGTKRFASDASKARRPHDRGHPVTPSTATAKRTTTPITHS